MLLTVCGHHITEHYVVYTMPLTLNGIIA